VCPRIGMKLQKSLGGSLDPEKRVSALGVKIAGVTRGGDGDLASNNSVRREMRRTGSCE
jgi:hypothetical protein